MLPFVSVLLARRYPHLVRRAVWVALGVNVVAMLASSFATDVATLIVLQGLVCGVSGSVLYLPALLYLPEWYVARRGVSYPAGLLLFGTLGTAPLTSDCFDFRPRLGSSSPALELVEQYSLM